MGRRFISVFLMNQTGLDSPTLRAQAEQIADAYPPAATGRKSLATNPDKIQVFLAAIADGNYRETACKVAGISKPVLYRWLKAADDGDEWAIAFRDALENAEGLAESETVRNVRNASKLPQFWAAGMTWLERKSPDRWGRRQDDSSAPKVVVQLGVSGDRVKVNVATFACSTQQDTGDLHRLTADTESDK